MPTYVALVRWTDEGARYAADTLNRADEVRRAAEQLGGRMTTLLWTQGTYDAVELLEMPDDETMAAFALAAGMQRGVRTQTLRAFSAEEMQRILQKLPQG